MREGERVRIKGLSVKGPGKGDIYILLILEKKKVMCEVITYG